MITSKITIMNQPPQQNCHVNGDAKTRIAAIAALTVKLIGEYDRSHRFKLLFRTGGAVPRKRMKNELRRHADLVPFNELAQRAQTKDYEMIRKIPEWA